MTTHEKHFRIAILDYQMPEFDGLELARAIRARPDGEGLELLLLTSAHDRMCVDGSAELGLAGVLTKPVKRAHLWNRLAACLEPKGALPVARAQASEAERDRGRSLRVLVVEDNRVNQRVIVRILDRFGHSSRVAANGAEALEALGRDPYDVVLMDDFIYGEPHQLPSN